jgi:predicted aspartyl protease
MKKNITKICIGFMVILFVTFSGCSIIKTIKAINGGKLVHGQEYTAHFELVENTIFIKVKINNSNQEYNFIFDTGAIDAIDEGLANKLGLKKVSSVTAKDAGGISKKTNIVNIEQLSIGNIIEKDLGFASLDLDFVSKMLDKQVDGIIGNNFLKFFTIMLNYQDSTISFSNNTEPFHKIENGFIIPFKQSMSNGYAPQVKCTLNNGFTTNAIIDCGNGGSILIPKSDIEKSNLLKYNTYISSKGFGSAGAMGVDKKNDSSKIDYLIRLNHFDIDSLHCSNLLAQSTNSNMGLIGYEFLSQFKVIINYPEKQLILIPFKQPVSFENNRNETGFGAIKTDVGNFKVINIWEKSQADSAGIKIGDEILELNSMKTIDLSNKSFHTILKDDKIYQYHLLIKSNGIEREVVLKKQLLLKEKR